VSVQDSAATTDAASPAKQTVGDVDYFYSGRPRPAVIRKLEVGAKVPVWIQEDNGANYWGSINGQGFQIRTSEGMDRPRMVPPALAGNYKDGHESEREAKRALRKLQEQMKRGLSDMPEYVR
jgi:hypothetical protein